MRGATSQLDHAFVSQDISIHAPREGSDEMDAERVDPADISIHAPREGSDRGYSGVL